MELCTAGGVWEAKPESLGPWSKFVAGDSKSNQGQETKEGLAVTQQQPPHHTRRLSLTKTGHTAPVRRQVIDVAASLLPIAKFLAVEDQGVMLVPRTCAVASGPWYPIVAPATS